MRSVVLAVGVWLWATVAAAQAPFPGAVLVNGGWVPCSHPIAIAAGVGCVATPATAPASAPLQVGRYYRNTSNTCVIRTLAIAVTHLHRRPMVIAETVDGWRAGWNACPEVAYFFDPIRPPEGQWIEVPASELGVTW